MSNQDTIAAISTPVGIGGIGIIRISGPRALAITQALFLSASSREATRSHHLTLGNIVDPARGTIIDQVLLNYMKAPKTYTREDVVEINCHSGPLVLKKILELVLKEGARLADPGEFSLRAFLNGRIDLTQAEGIVELILAQTDQALEKANKLLQGELQQLLKGIQENLLSLLAQLEAAIDFPEEELEILDRKDWNRLLQNQILLPLTQLIRAYEDGLPFREGLSLVIVGKPNVGKSSLLNTLLKEERAIVTSIPGTTRDTIEETILLKGLPFRLVDTAGIRRARDEVEEAGILRTREKVYEAQIVLFLIDTSNALEEEDRAIFQEIQEKPKMILLNKMDLPSVVSMEEIQKQFPCPMTLQISARYRQGIDTLKEKLHELFLQDHFPEALPDLMPTLRQKKIFEQMVESLTRAFQLSEQNQSLEFIALDLQKALEELGSLIGTTTNEDVLDRIFSRFCIGK
ncbi:MAG: tRNA uridine-5-carboxymethylaminomethyl(34) synthesis GTPase MnmE [Deltaproteobacteria bacterium RBG_13_43_22]|nr:MAG: tRNA uridine-5-carboxymethylaminomethyl(34) synthesis GTPase MnmE [Deltaproteobacteria bacterium RBG_13_43_22]